MCFGAGTTAGTQTVAGHTFTPTAISPSLYSSGIPASYNYAAYAAPANYYQSPAAMGTTGSLLGAGNAAYRAPANYFRTTSTGLPTIGRSMTSTLPQKVWKSTAGPGGVLEQIFGGGGKTGEGAQKNWLPEIMMGLGSLIPQPKSTIPSGQELLSQYQGTELSPEGAAARAKTLEFINAPEKIGSAATTDYIAALNADYDQQDAAELAQFDSAWVAQGYTTTGSDYFKARNELINKQGIRRNTAIGAVRQDVWSKQVQAQLAMIAQAYGIDQQMLEELMSLDVYTAAQKYGLSVEKVNQFRQAIYDMALMSASNQQGNQTTAAIQQLTAAMGGVK